MGRERWRLKRGGADLRRLDMACSRLSHLMIRHVGCLECICVFVVKYFVFVDVRVVF